MLCRFFIKRMRMETLSEKEFTAKYFWVESVLLKTAINLTDNIEDSKDLIQESIYRAYKYRTQYTPWTNFKARMTTIVWNTFLTSQHKKNKFRLISDKTEINDANISISVDNTANSEMWYKQIIIYIKMLDGMFSVPFLMFYRWLEYKEISKHLNIPVGTVKSRLFLARKKLKKIIIDHED